jgi:RNA polymerase sigma-70 factor, ECF subfamily
MTEEAFTRAYDQHSDAIFRHCFFRIRDREQALDLMQQTFMKTWKSIQKGKEITQLKSFLFKVANNLIVDHSRKKKSTSLDTLMEAGFDPSQEENPQLQDRLDAQKKLEILDELEPPSYREVILLRYVEDLTITEIAETLDTTENTVSVRINRAINKLRKLLKNG